MKKPITQIKIAIVHEWLTTYGGSERVVEQMLRVFPQSELFALVDFLPPAERGFLGGRQPQTTFLQKWPFARTAFRSYLPFMPLAVEQFDLSGFDLVLSSHHAVAKNVLTGPNQCHISYVHSPMRYAWDHQFAYLRESGLHRGVKGWLARAVLHYLRLCDLRGANGVDAFIANSAFIARRLWKTYRREARVIYPPVAVHAFPFFPVKEDYYLTAARLVPYKRIPLIVQAFSQMPDRQLVVVGDGPGLAAVKAIARDVSNIRVLGALEHSRMVAWMQKARAFVFAGEEDFGITLVEAQACGTPVIAYGRGGALETIVGLDSPKPTGLFFQDQTVDAIKDAVRRFEQEPQGINPEHCHHNALRFDVARFIGELREFVGTTWEAFLAGRPGQP